MSSRCSSPLFLISICFVKRSVLLSVGLLLCIVGLYACCEECSELLASDDDFDDDVMFSLLIFSLLLVSTVVFNADVLVSSPMKEDSELCLVFSALLIVETESSLLQLLAAPIEVMY